MSRLSYVAAGAGVTYAVFAHFCDASSDPQRPTFHRTVIRPGEKVAAYALIYSDGTEHVQPIRRRFEISEAVRWGHGLLPPGCMPRTNRSTLTGRTRGRSGAHQTGERSGFDVAGSPMLWCMPCRIRNRTAPCRASGWPRRAGMPGGPRITLYRGTDHLCAINGWRAFASLCRTVRCLPAPSRCM